jgi:hypothetical protein
MGMDKQQGSMGIRDLEVFNLALLAKQGWRILQYPDSLVARILWEKFFPSDSFLTANVGSRHSIARRNICQAKEVLKGGLWRWTLAVGWKWGEH